MASDCGIARKGLGVLFPLPIPILLDALSSHIPPEARGLVPRHAVPPDLNNKDNKQGNCTEDETVLVCRHSSLVVIAKPLMPLRDHAYMMSTFMKIEMALLRFVTISGTT
jgi:hypothetical protein